jgi:predicted RNase H-like HicB family nuclease
VALLLARRWLKIKHALELCGLKEDVAVRQIWNFGRISTIASNALTGSIGAGQSTCHPDSGAPEQSIMQKQFTALIEREGNGYVSLCPELDIASQGATIEEARENLREALELFFETASPEEIQTRLHEEVYVTRLEIAIG